MTIMPNKTEDIETAVLSMLGYGPLTVAEIEAAVEAVLADGRAVMVGCHAGHHHSGDCVIEAAR